MQFDFLPEWIYTFLIIPIVILYKQHFSLKNNVTELKANQKIYIEKVEKMCASNEKLAKEVNQMLGEWKEHLRKGSN